MGSKLVPCPILTTWHPQKKQNVQKPNKYEQHDSKIFELDALNTKLGYSLLIQDWPIGGDVEDHVWIPMYALGYQGAISTWIQLRMNIYKTKTSTLIHSFQITITHPFRITIHGTTI